MYSNVATYRMWLDETFRKKINVHILNFYNLPSFQFYHYNQQIRKFFSGSVTCDMQIVTKTRDGPDIKLAGYPFTGNQISGLTSGIVTCRPDTLEIFGREHNIRSGT